jgi:hypothetical protein
MFRTSVGYLVILLALPAMPQQAPRFTARELFYSASQPPAPAAKPPAARKKAAPPTAVASTPKTAAPAAPTPPQPTSQPAALPDGAHIIAASVTVPAPTAGPALGLRYTILKRIGDQMVEVAPNTVFHAGDRIQLDIETNGPGYLYIVSQGSSGTWKPMFPSKDVEDGNNRVEPFRDYSMPPRSRFVFDEQSGQEKLFVVLSRNPEPDLENLIYSLQGPKAKPVSEPAAAPQPKPLVADLRIDDATVGLLRNAYARDLIVEKVDENSPGDKKEKAVYVVNPTGSSDSRVVADIVLVHQ